MAKILKITNAVKKARTYSATEDAMKNLQTRKIIQQHKKALPKGDTVEVGVDKTPQKIAACGNADEAITCGPDFNW